MRSFLCKTVSLLLLLISLHSQAQQRHMINKRKAKTAAVPQFTPPQFPGGDSVLKAYLRSRIRYPAAARENEIQGTVTLSFFINEQGHPEDTQVTRDIGAGCGREAVRVVQQMPAWIPGSYGNRKTRMWYELPVSFKLQ